jgi:REP element-mobilizing transposase RayT
MPRRERPTAAGFYHVAARSQRDDELFRDTADVLRFESELRQIVATCIAVCVLPTHYHLLLEVGENALSGTVGRLNQRYARAFNARYARRGHAFSERFMSVAVESDEHLMNLYRYVARNPVEAGLCARAEDWSWSSYPTLLGLGDRFAFVDPCVVVELCDGVERVRRFVDGDP